MRAWRAALDEAGREGVACGEVEERVYDKATGRARAQGTSSDEDGAEAAAPPAADRLDAQQLGMLNAHNREVVRRAARLLVHYRFQHFAPRSIGHAGDATQPRGDQGDADDAAVWKEPREVEPVRRGKRIEDVTHAKGEWGLRWKQE